MGSQIKDNYNSLTWREQKPIVLFASTVRYWLIGLMRLVFGRQLKCVCQESYAISNHETKVASISRERNVDRQCQNEDKWAERQEKMNMTQLRSCRY